MKNLLLIAVTVSSITAFSDQKNSRKIAQSSPLPVLALVEAQKLVSADIHGVTFVTVFTDGSTTTHLELCDEPGFGKAVYLQQMQPMTNYAIAHKLGVQLTIDLANKCVSNVAVRVGHADELK